MTRPREPIALFVPSLRGGGAEYVAMNLARGLVELGAAVDVVAAQALGEFRTRIPAGAQVVDLGARRVLLALRPLARYLQQVQPRAVIGFMDHANIVALWARRLSGTTPRVVVTVHNTLSAVLRHQPRLGDRLLPGLIHRFYPWADEIVAVSQGVAADLSRTTGLAVDRIRVVYNPVIATEPETAAVALPPPPHPWFMTGEPPVILGVGRLTRQKDFPLLVRAFAMVRAHRPTRLIILGEGPERPELERLVRVLGLEADVLLPGFVAGTPAFMRHAALFALSSAWEGLPTVLIEALASGTPVVATDCPSGPREILCDGALGRLVPSGDAGALAQALLEQLSQPRTMVPADALRPFTQAAACEAYFHLACGNGRST